MDSSIQHIIQSAQNDIAACNDLQGLEQIRVTLLGKKGSLTSLLSQLGTLSPEERKEQGQLLNEAKDHLHTLLDEKRRDLETAALEAQLTLEALDITLAPYGMPSGKIHPITHTMMEIMEILGSMGFQVAEGPDVEDDFHNFTALNVPLDHPARQEQDTFYMATHDGPVPNVLRTHTSGVQIRTLMKQEPPVKVMALGRTFRADYDQTHTPMFHQTEGLWIDKGHKVTFADLKGCLSQFLRTFFGKPDLFNIRFRPGFFPFTEPSAEVDIQYRLENNMIHLGEGDRWLEVLGCGMVHPHVLKNCGLDPATHQGFAFGMGIERLAMLKYGIPDLRTFYESDTRWLNHYGFNPIFIPSLLTRGTL